MSVRMKLHKGWALLAPIVSLCRQRPRNRTAFHLPEGADCTNASAQVLGLLEHMVAHKQ